MDQVMLYLDKLKNMNIEFENIETLFTYQLRGILAQTEAEIAEVKERVEMMSNELELLGKEPSEEDMVTIDMVAQFMAVSNIIKYQVKAELFNRRFELN